MNRVLLLLMVAGVLIGSAVGCGNGASPPGDSSSGVIVAKNIDDGVTALWPDQVECPVTTEMIDPNYYAEVDGKRVYFANAEAVDEFRNNQQKYLRMWNPGR